MKIRLLCFTTFLFFLSGTGEAFDQTHSEWTQLLSKHVHEEKVDYRGFLKDRALLKEYLTELSSPTPQEFQKWTEEEKLAFWINVYNALAVKIVLDHYPVPSVKKISGVWDRFTLHAAGQKVSLNQIEHKILRKEFKEPRIHMAIVCASKGCPPLRGEAYAASKLEQQLDENARLFFKDASRAKWDPQEKALFLSPIFSWFGGDFGSRREILLFAKRYLPKEISDQMDEKKTRLRWLSYDWSLNE